MSRLSSLSVAEPAAADRVLPLAPHVTSIRDTCTPGTHKPLHAGPAPACTLTLPGRGVCVHTTSLQGKLASIKSLSVPTQHFHSYMCVLRRDLRTGTKTLTRSYSENPETASTAILGTAQNKAILRGH